MLKSLRISQHQFHRQSYKGMITLSNLESEFNICQIRCICVFCNKNKRNNRPKVWKSLASLGNHVRRCPNHEFVPELNKIEIYRLVISAKIDPQNISKLHELGMVLA